jgi:hypothetical protein
LVLGSLEIGPLELLARAGFKLRSS